MTQFEKLQDILKNPSGYSVKKNTCVYKCLQKIAMYGIAQTGTSSRNSKKLFTVDVLTVLRNSGICCECYNNAPRGGANGEHVKLRGKVYKDVVYNFAAFKKNCENSGIKKYYYIYNIEQDYIKELLK